MFEADTRAGRQFDFVPVAAVLIRVVVVLLGSVEAISSQPGHLPSAPEWRFTLRLPAKYPARLRCVRRPLRYATGSSASSICCPCRRLTLLFCCREDMCCRTYACFACCEFSGFRRQSAFGVTGAGEAEANWRQNKGMQAQARTARAAMRRSGATPQMAGLGGSQAPSRGS